MKLAKFAILLVIPVLALLLLGGVFQPPKAEAYPTKVLTINPVLCTVLTNGKWVSAEVGLNRCDALNTESNFRDLIRVLRADESDPADDPTPADLAPIDSDGGQMHESDGVLFIVAFVTNDQPVSFYADRGIFPASGTSSIACGPSPQPSYQVEDEDCDNDGVRGDGVVVVKLVPNGADRGPANVRVRQGNIEQSEPYQIVGEPRHISINALQTVIQTGSPRCDLFSDTASFIAALNDPETTPFMVTISDSDGTALTGAFADITVSNPDAASVVLPFSPTLDLGSSLGQVGPNVICGGKETGVITLTAQITSGGFDFGAGSRDAEVKITVVGPPTDMALTASPSGLTCDGVNGSTVSAALTDAEGNPVVDGNRVHFEVRALGVANPLAATTKGGAATTTLVPVDGTTGGVVVRAWVDLPVPFAATPTPEPTSTPDPEASPTPVRIVAPTPTDQPSQVVARTAIEKTVLVACQEAAAPVSPPSAPPSGSQQPAIAPPNTGTGGTDSGLPAWWLALPLSAVALLAAGAGLALKRRAA